MTEPNKQEERNRWQSAYETVSRIAEAIKKGVGLYLRVSTGKQVLDSEGSIQFQKDQVLYLKERGVDPEDIKIYDDLGKTASRGIVGRNSFSQLISDIEAGLIGLVVIAFADRAQRTFDRETQRIYDALEEHGGLVLVGGAYYDPAVPGDRAVLEMLAVLAKFMNRQRAVRTLTARLAKARVGTAFVPLATGLVWGNPDDPEFAAAMDRAKLKDHISPASLSSHWAKRTKNSGDTFYVLPDPRPGVHKAALLTINWFLESGSIEDVIHRICHDSEWPEGKAGKFPATKRSIFDSDSEPDWNPLVNREDGKDDLAYGVIHQWLTSRSLYGIYSLESKAIKKLSKDAAKLGTEVYRIGAFPGIASATDYDEVKRKLAAPVRRMVGEGSFNGPRTHLVPYLYCGHTLSDGRPCGRRLSPLYTNAAGGLLSYKSVSCGKRGHSGSVAVIDETVRELVLEVFTPRVLRRELSVIQKDVENSDVVVKKLRQEVNRLEKAAKFQMEAAENANEEDREDAAEKWVQRHRKTIALLRHKSAALGELMATRDRRMGLAEKEANRVLKLAGDLPELLRRAKQRDGLASKLMMHLTDRVWSRRLGRYVYEVTVVFPSGLRKVGIHFAARVPAPQALRVIARHTLGNWAEERPADHSEEMKDAEASATALADRLNSFWHPQYCDQPEWSSERIRALALWNVHEDESSKPSPDGRTISGLAAFLSASEEEVFQAACLGKLGDAWLQSGDIILAPSDAELHAAFPEFARRSVAQSVGVEWEMISRVETLATEFTKGYSYVRRRAVEADCLLKDAAGRIYTYRWLFCPQAKRQELEARLAKLRPVGAVGENGRWMTGVELKEEFGMWYRTVERTLTISCTPGVGPAGIRSKFYWVTPEMEARFKRR